MHHPLGTGSDGTLGLRAIKAHGGLTLAQSSDSAEYDGMTRSAVGTGLVDFILPAEELPAKIADYFSQCCHLAGSIDGTPVERAAGDELGELYALMNARTGHNFNGYKERAVLRAVQRCMQSLQIRQVKQFIEHTRNNPQQLDVLLQHLLIGVTNFFRDRAAFAALEHEIIPNLFDAGVDGTIRVWVPGCSTGEEAYSIAILLLEQLPKAAKRPRLQIFASDINEESLEIARAGRYPATIAQDVSARRLERFFVREGDTYRVTASLREICLFSPHNLLRDPPFSRLDFIACRNVLIYFDSELQNRVIPLFHYALRGSGYLFLGTSEGVTRHGRLFSTVDKPHRIFRREHHVEPRRHAFPWLPPGEPRRAAKIQPKPVPATELLEVAERLILDQYAPAFVVINVHGDILQSSARTGKYLELPPGAPDTNVFALARRGLRGELRALVRKSIAQQQTVVRSDVHVSSDRGRQPITLTVQPLPADASTEALYMVVFRDLGGEPTALDPLPSGPDVEAATRQIEADLRATRGRLQNITEELESSNEELKSANEELSSINEELQSTNEELHKVNAELNIRVEELGRINDDIRNLLENTQIATVFLDRSLNIKSFTPAAREVFRLVDGDVGRPLSHVRSRFNHAGLQDDLGRVLHSLATIEHYVQRIDSAALYVMRMLPYRTVDNVIAGVVITFTDITRISAAEAKIDELTVQLRDRVDSLQTILELLPVGVLISNENRPKELTLNRHASRFLDPPAGHDENVRGDEVIRLFDKERELAPDEQPLQSAARSGSVVPAFDGRLLRADGSFAHVVIRAAPLFDKFGKARGAVASVTDLTEHDELGAARRDIERRSHDLLAALPVAVYTTNAAGSIEFVNAAARTLWGREPDPATDRWSGALRMFWPDGRAMPHDECPMAATLKTGRGVQGQEIFIDRADGTRVPCLAYPTPLHDAGGRLIGGVNALVEITERKHADDVQHLLMDELNHRVKNTLATVQSIAARSFKAVADRGQRDAFDSRLAALSRTHDLLAEERWASASLRSLLVQELEPYNTLDGASCTMDGPHLALNPKAALALGMTFHELATNAVKHGALSTPLGRVHVAWNVGASAAPPVLNVRWAETGGPPVRDRTHRGFGSALIERGLALELEGEVALVFERSGLVCSMVMPLHFVQGH